MNIDPSLQSFMDSYLKIGRATFAKSSDDKELEDTMLLTLSGLGLAKVEHRNKEIIWVPTDKLKALEKSSPAPIDLAPFLEAEVDGAGEPRMTGSLKLIIEDVVATGRRGNSEQAKNVTVDSTLFALSQMDLISYIKTPDDDWIWAANPNLINSYEMGKEDAITRTNHRPKINLDDVLKGLAKFLHKMAKAQFGGIIDRRAATVGMLISHEIGDHVIAYKDEEGQLAWKASDEMRRELE